MKAGDIATVEMPGMSIHGLRCKILRKQDVSGDFLVELLEERNMSHKQLPKIAGWRIGDKIQVKPHELRPTGPNLNKE